MMETRRLLDELTNHFSLYHLSVESRERARNRRSGVAEKDRASGDRDRQKVIEWFKGLNVDQRLATLTVVDKPWVAILLQMQKKLETSGAGYFFLLPDVPCMATGIISSHDPHHEFRAKNSSASGVSSSDDPCCKYTVSNGSPVGVVSADDARHKSRAKSGSPSRIHSQFDPCHESRAENSLAATVSTSDELYRELRAKPSSKSRGSSSSGKGHKSKPSSGLKGHQNSNSSSKKSGIPYNDRIEDMSQLPSLCYRKAKGLLGRLTDQQAAGDLVVNNLKLFSSQDGERIGDRAPCAEPYPALDTITFSSGFVKDVDEFIGVMDTLSYHKFLSGASILGSSTPWDETDWLKCMGYYAMPAYIVNKLEFALWAGWISTIGTKKLAKPGSSAKARKSNTMECIAPNCPSSVQERAVIAARICEKRRGCVEQWSKLDANAKSNLLHVALKAATKYEVQVAARQAEKAFGGESTDISRFRRYHNRKNIIDFKGGSFALSSCGSSVIIPLPAFVKLGTALAISELWPTSIDSDDDMLFYSFLNASQSLSDRIMRNVRNSLVKVMTASAELELIHSDNTANKPTKSGTEKSKAKREKNTSRKRGQNHAKNASFLHQDKALAEKAEVFNVLEQETSFKTITKEKAAQISCLQTKHEEKGSFLCKQEKTKMNDNASKRNGVESCKKIVSMEEKKEETIGPSTAAESHLTVDPKEASHGLIQVGKAFYPVTEWMPAFSEGVACSHSDIRRLQPFEPKLAFLESAHSIGSCKEFGDCSTITATKTDTSSNSPRIQTFKSCIEGSSGQAMSVDLSTPIELGSSMVNLDADERQIWTAHVATARSSDDLVKGVPAVVHMPNGPSQILNETGKICRSVPSTLTIEIGRLKNVQNRNSGAHQHAAFVLPVSHEWHGSPQARFSGGVCLPATCDRLHLDAVKNSHPNVQPSLVSLREASLGCQPIPLQSLQHRNASVQTASACLDWPLFSQSGISVAPAMGYSLNSTEEPAYYSASPFSTSPYACSLSAMESNGHYSMSGEGDPADRISETGYDDTTYLRADLDDPDRHRVLEDEYERRLQSSNAGFESDYNQIFGGGVMYWTAADYTGMGYSRPGSLSSEDSTWARREADLGLVIDDIVGLPSLTSSFSNLSSSSMTLSNTSPALPSSAISFESASGVPAPSCLGLSKSGVDNGGKYISMHPVGAPKKEDLQLTLSGAGSRGTVSLTASDHNLRPVLRPIIVVRDLSLSEQAGKGELTYLHEARSPHMPRGRRDTHRWKRSPSPILRCAPVAPPPPPPPSPVGDVRKRRGFTNVRSGSSSPRHWGMATSTNKQDFETQEVQWKNLKSEAGSRWREKCLTATPPIQTLSGALLYERLLPIPPLPFEQEHDVALPIQSSLLYSNDPAFQLTISKIQNELHDEIEAFCLQVAAENLIRKPYINVAIKKVTHALQVLWPRSRTKLFGSNATGLALPNSDVDLVVCLPPVRNLEPIKEAGILEGRNGIKETCLQHAARYLADQDWVQSDSLKTIENTAIPIIVLVAKISPDHCDTMPTQFQLLNGKVTTMSPLFNSHTATNTYNVGVQGGSHEGFEVYKGPWGDHLDRQYVQLDISFEALSHTGLRTSELVRELIAQYPAMSPLALVLKQFLTDRCLDQPYTGGMSSYCLVLLITRFLQHQLHFCRTPQNQNLGSLLMDFLHFFGHVFDPRQMGVCIRGGGMYVTRDRFHCIDPLDIEDPLHPMNNVGRNCFRILQCIKAFADAYNIIERELLEASRPCTDTTDEGNFRLLRKILPSISKG